jgi:uncharacterized membrane protein YkvA (DUF1232 family)
MKFQSIARGKTSIPRRRWWERQQTRLKRDLVFANKQFRLLALLLRHSQVPWPAKIAGGCAMAYIFSPIQLIPSFIPVIGQMDDLLVLFLGKKVISKFTPDSVLDECEARATIESSAQVERWEDMLRQARVSRSMAA